MRHALLPVLAAVALFIIGIFILNLQLWYSSGSSSLAGALYAVRNMNGILNEARQATQTAENIARTRCGVEGGYQLGTEAALQPHLRTIIIFDQGEPWCSSLPGNRVLLRNIREIPDTELLLAPAKNTVNKLPILLFQNNVAGKRIVVTISDSHIRDALSTPFMNVQYSLVVGNRALGMTGDTVNVSRRDPHSGQLNSEYYPYSIRYNLPPLFSLHRLISQGGGVVLFILLISVIAGYVLNKYLNKNTTPAETLRRAIEKGEIIPFYQPIVDGREGTLRGIEVLARWKHPRVGFIPPVSFIPIAEKSGLIVPLTQSLMRQVAAHMNLIATKLPEGFHVGINFSAAHIASSSFVAECLEYKHRFVRPDLNLVIELTEREPLKIDDHLVQTLNILHENGFAIALDDFGTGYSGLSYLHDLHIDYIKIDQSFVNRVNEHKDSTRILDAVLELARSLSISIVAEGVETQQQLDYLNRNNITFLQGYYFFKPVPFNGLVKILLSKPKVKVLVE